MATIPSYHEFPELDTKQRLMPNMRRSGVEGKAIARMGQALGNTLSNIGKAYNDYQKQGEDFKTGLSWEEKKAEWAKINAQRGDDMPQEGDGFHALQTQKYNDFWGPWVESLPEDQREQYQLKVAKNAVSVSAQSAGEEYTQSNKFEQNAITDVGNSIADQVRLDHGTLEDQKINIDAVIEKSKLPEEARTMLREHIYEKMESAAFVDHYNKNPEEALVAIGVLPNPEFNATVTEKSRPGFIRRMTVAESGGDPKAAADTSTAYGAHQFISGTWADMISQHRPDLWKKYGSSEAGVAHLRANPKLSEEMAYHYADLLQANLEAHGMAPTLSNMYLSWFLGPGDAPKVLRANNNASIKSIIDAGSYAANPNVFNKIHTIGQLKNWATKKMGITPGSAPYKYTDPNPRYASLDQTKRTALVNTSQKNSVALQKAQSIQMAASIDDNLADGLTGISVNGVDNSQQFTQDEYVTAYGEIEGKRKFKQHGALKEAETMKYNMRDMKPTEMDAMISDKMESLEAGDGNEAENAAVVKQLVDAKAALIEARNADPVGAVRRVNDTVDRMYKDAEAAPKNSEQRAMLEERAMRASLAAQRDLGIPMGKRKALSASMSEGVKDIWAKESTVPITARIEASWQIYGMVTDPTQRKMVFNEMVNAGMPESLEASLIAYYRIDYETGRPDHGAARELADAAVMDPTARKSLPGYAASDLKKEIDTAISDVVYSDKGKGKLYYGTDMGNPANRNRFARDAEVLRTMVYSFVGNSGEIEAGIAKAERILMGNVEPYTTPIGPSRIEDAVGAEAGVPEEVGEFGNINTRILLPSAMSSDDRDAFHRGLREMYPQVVESLKRNYVKPPPTGTDQAGIEMHRAMSGTMVRDAIKNGFFRNVGDGVGFYDTISRSGHHDGTGRAVFWTIEELVDRGKLLLGR